MRNDAVKDAAMVAALLAMVVALALAVSPAGEFPVGDDWDYAFTSFDLVRHGELRLSDFPAMTLASHVAWGAAWVAAFGESHAALRCASLTMLFLAAWGGAATAREMGLGRRWALLLGLATVGQPMLATLAFTFHTNVTGAAAMAWSVWAALRCLRAPTTMNCAATGLLGAAAYLVRQPAGVPALCALPILALDVVRGRLPLHRAVVFGSALGTPVAIYYAWLAVHGVPYFQRYIIADVGRLRDLGATAHRALDILLPLAFFLAPFAFAAAGRVWDDRRRRLTALAAPAMLVAASFALGHATTPVAGMHHYDLGMSNDFSLPHDRAALSGPAFGAFGATIAVYPFVAAIVAWWSFGLLAGMVAAPRREAAARPTVFLALSLTAAVALLLIVRSLHVWYLIPAWQLAALLLAARAAALVGPVPPPSAWLAVGVFILLSATFAHENRVRHQAVWEAIDALHRLGATPDQVNGGFEYAGVFRFSPQYRGSPRRVRPFLADLAKPDLEMHLIFMNPLSEFESTRRYAIAPFPLPNHEIVSEHPYRGWTRPGRMLVQRRR